MDFTNCPESLCPSIQPSRTQISRIKSRLILIMNEMHICGGAEPYFTMDKW